MSDEYQVTDEQIPPEMLEEMTNGEGEGNE